MGVLTINAASSDTVEIFGLDEATVKHLIPMISEILTRWERKELKAGGAVAEAAAIARNDQEQAFCLMIIAAAMQRSLIMAQAAPLTKHVKGTDYTPKVILLPGSMNGEA